MVVRLSSIIVFILLVLLGCQSARYNQKVEVNDLNLRPYYQINYNLASGGERYQFIVDLLEFEPYRSFKFTMTNTNETSSVITITPGALDTGYAEKNYFNRWVDTLDDKTLTVWFSNYMFSTLLAGDTAYFDGDIGWAGIERTAYYNAGRELYSYELNGVPQTIEVIKVVEAEKTKPKKFWVLNNPKNPMIVKMNVGWEIWLKEINHNYE
jgi:hypothetical protein